MTEATGTNGVTSIGRGPDNDVVVDDLRVSRRHAEIVLAASGGHELCDLRSRNGTFLNGRQVTRAPLTAGDLVSVGSTLLRFTGTTLEAVPDASTGWLVAEHLVVETEEGKVLLDDVSFSLPPGSFLAVLGPSGSGKSTLLNALVGLRPANRGTVSFAGRDIYSDYESLSHRMGYVPQDDVLHPQLTVSQALDYAARLRFPSDVDAAERQARIDDVLAELRLTDRRDLAIERLSGGQRERASTALELLTRPLLLFLDEPTSGLDPGNERQVMSILRELTKVGRTIVAVTHKLDSLDLCDRVLLLAPGGRLAYYGPPQELLAYFSRHGWGTDYPTVYRSLDDAPNADWHGAFAADEVADRYVDDAIDRARAAQVDAAVAPPPSRISWARQVRVLAARHLATIRGDRRTLLLLVAQAPFFAGLFLLLMRSDKFTTATSGEALALIWLLMLAATWLGTSNAVREIVKELPIYRRERAVGVSATAYVASKVVVLGGITAVQCLVLGWLVLLPQTLPPYDSRNVYGNALQLNEVALVSGIDRSLLFETFPDIAGRAGAALPSPRVELILGLVVAGVAAMAVGLLVSGLVRSQDRALVMLPLVLVAQVVLSLPFLPADSQVLKSAGVVSSTRWGMSTAASTVSLNQLRALDLVAFDLLKQSLSQLSPSPPPPRAFEDVLREAAEKEPRWTHDETTWWGNVFAMAVLAAIALIATLWAVQRDDPVRAAARARQAKLRTAGATTPG